MTARSMSILSTSERQAIVCGVKSTIRKKSTAKSSSCHEYARASLKHPSEDQIIRVGSEQTIGTIYRMFRKISGGADGGVSGVNGSICPSCLKKVLCALEVNGREFIDFGAGDGRALLASLLKGATRAYGYELPANKAHRFVLNAIVSKMCSDECIGFQKTSTSFLKFHAARPAPSASGWGSRSRRRRKS